ncbi:hypothetical protein GA0115246_1097810, partial [Streptomyces sp. SolWspMP-sol7th]
GWFGERGENAARVHGTRKALGGLGAECEVLPGGVALGGGRGPPARYGTRAGAGHEQPLGGEPREGARDGDGPDAVPCDEFPARRQLSTRRIAVELGTEEIRQFPYAATLLHET